MFEVVVVVFEGGAGVVGGIDVDALHLSRVERQDRPQRLQVVAVDEQVVARPIRQRPILAQDLHRAVLRRPASSSPIHFNIGISFFPSRATAMNAQRKIAIFLQPFVFIGRSSFVPSHGKSATPFDGGKDAPRQREDYTKSRKTVPWRLLTTEHAETPFGRHGKRPTKGSASHDLATNLPHSMDDSGSAGGMLMKGTKFIFSPSSFRAPRSGFPCLPWFHPPIG